MFRSTACAWYQSPQSKIVIFPPMGSQSTLRLCITGVHCLRDSARTNSHGSEFELRNFYSSWCVFHEYDSNLNPIYDIKTFIGGFRKATGGAMFYGNACCATVLFLRLAKRWSGLMRQWNDVEFRLDLTSDGHTRENKCRARTLIAVILILATGKLYQLCGVKLFPKRNKPILQVTCCIHVRDFTHW